MRDSCRTRVDMQAAAVLSAISLMSADSVATPGVMMFIGASLFALIYNLTRHHSTYCYLPRFVRGRQRRDTRTVCRACASCGRSTTGAADLLETDHHGCRCKRGNAFAAAREAQPLRRGCLDRHAGEVEAQDLGDALAHGVAVRRDPGGFAQDRHIHVAD